MKATCAIFLSAGFGTGKARSGLILMERGRARRLANAFFPAVPDAKAVSSTVPLFYGLII